jgi:dienelactone hydrolase
MYIQYVYYRQHKAKMSLRILILTIVVFNTTLDVIEPAYAEDQRPHISDEKVGRDWSKIPTIIKSSFTPPPEFIGDFGTYKSLLTFKNGKHVKTETDWKRRRKEILTEWLSLIGSWPELIEKPKIHYSEQTRRDNITQRRISIEIGPDGQIVTGYLLVPDGDGPFPAVLVVYYDAETGTGLGKELRDFGYQLAKRGFVAISIGTPEFCSLKPPYRPLCKQSETEPPLQPLSALAYVAANCHNALANIPSVDAQRIGIIGHSYGGKWAMFASCLYGKFACAVWSDPGIVFDEGRANINYWEPWYLGYEPDRQRQRGVPNITNPRTGAYKELIHKGHDLHELHALMAPRPFLVSGGAEDPPKRWKALNHSVAVNKLLGYDNRVAMTNRESHSPTLESNNQIYSFFEYFLKHNNLAYSGS